MKSGPPYPTLRWLLNILLFAGIYFVAARLSLLLAFGNTNASPVWPPSGIAFGTILFFGYRYWPGITIGAFMANTVVFAINQVAPSPWPILAISLIIAIGNTLEALAGVFLVRYILGPKDPLENPVTIFRYLVIVITACLVSSVIGSLSLCLFKFISWNTYLLVWFTWWLGDAAGILVLSTLFLPFYKRHSLHLKFRPIFESVLFLFFIFFINMAVFGGLTEASLRHDPLSYLFIPVIVWAIFRLGEHGLGVTVLMIITTAIWGTIHGYGPFAKPVLNESLLLLEGFVGVVTMTGLVLMATLRENRQAHRIIEEREKWFRSLVEHSHDIITLLDQHGRIIYSSPATITVLGYALKEYVGKNIFSFIHPDDLDMIKGRFKEILEEPGSSVSDECRFRHANGSWKWLEGTGVNLIKDENVRAIVVNCRDITTRRQAQESQARLAAIVNNSSDAIIGKTLEGDITSWNRGAVEIYGYRPDDVLGRSMMILIPPARQQEYLGIMQRLKHGEEIPPFESVRQRKDGTLIDVSLTISLVRNNKGEVVGASTIARDITERKRAQERLKRYAQELKESNEDLENFAFVASHDLQEPLRIVASYIQMFAKRYKESTDANVNKYITYIVDNVARMQEMINGLLEYSRIGKKSQSYHHMEASRACDRAISNLDLAINKKQASVTRDDLPTVWGNETELTQLFQNLIGNAIKYCDKKPQIHVGVIDDNGYWTFFIKDNGIGIEKQYCEQIFDVFKRLHTKAEYPGTGIGLSICKKIIEKNGGQVWVESVPGVGSTFFFTMSKSEKNERSLR